MFAAQPPPLPDEDVAADMLAACAPELAQAGYAQYEVSAYARPGRQCRHNLNYWSFGDYLGIGAGAHGKLTFPARGQIVRTTQLRDPRRYQAAVDAALTRRAIAPRELPFEFMLNALRLCDGFAAAMFTERTGLELQAIAAPLETAVQRGLVLSTATGYRPSALGLRFLNDTLLLFMAQTTKMSGDSGLSIAAHDATSGIPAALFTGSGRSVAE